MKRLIRVCTAVFVLAGAGACDRTISSPDTGNPKLPPPPTGFVVSAARAFTSAAITSGATSPALSAAGQVVYVSAEPGTLPGAVSAEIQGSLTGANPIVIPVIDFGFDPVAVPASSGEQLTLTLIKANGQTTSYGVSVPPRRPPTIVRTNPANGRTDVALTQVVTAVFSEPVDPATVNAASVKLLQSGQQVSAVVSLESNGWAADIAPVNGFQSQTIYTLIVGKVVRNLDGDALLADDTVTFSTVAPTVGQSSTLVASYDLQMKNGPTTYSGGGKTWVILGAHYLLYEDGSYRFGYVFQDETGIHFNPSGGYYVRVSATVIQFYLAPGSYPGSIFYQQRGGLFSTGTLDGRTMSVKYEDPVDFEDEVYVLSPPSNNVMGSRVENHGP